MFCEVLSSNVPPQLEVQVDVTGGVLPITLTAKLAVSPAKISDGGAFFLSC